MANSETDWVDLEHIRKMSNGNPSFVINMLNIYIQDLSDYLLQMQVALGQKDYDQVRYLGHRMKSPAAIIRVDRLDNMLNALESAAESEHEALLKTFDELTLSHDQITTILRTELSGLDSDKAK